MPEYDANATVAEKNPQEIDNGLTDDLYGSRLARLLLDKKSRNSVKTEFKASLQDVAEELGYDNNLVNLENDPEMLQVLVHLSRPYTAIKQNYSEAEAKEFLNLETGYINGEISFDDWSKGVDKYLQMLSEDYNINLQDSRNRLVEDFADDYTIDDALLEVSQAPSAAHQQRLITKMGLSATQGLKEPDAADVISEGVKRAIANSEYGKTINFGPEAHTTQAALGKAMQAYQSIDDLTQNMKRYRLN